MLWGITLLLFGMISGVIVGHQITSAYVKNREANRPAMERKIAKINLQRMPLDAAVDQIQNQAHANIAVDWLTLEAAGVDRNSPVTVKANDLPLRRVLDLLCREAGNGTVKLMARADQGVVIISTAEELSHDTIVRLYDVRDLVISDHDLRLRLHRLLDRVGLNSDAPSTTPSLRTIESRADSIDSLVRVIVQMVEPDSWRDAGGTIGSIREFAGQLVIVQTPEAHDQIAELLGQLRKRT
jgi:hypothetical protein